MTNGLWEQLPNIDVPAVIIGSGDGDGPAAIAPLVAKRLGNARVR